MGNTKIEWPERTWNPVTGCTKISPGCQNCYAERMAKRLRGRYGYPANEPFRVTLRPERLVDPLHWRKPSMIFVCSMGDLFHEDVPDAFIAKIWHIMAISQEHIFIIPTKRPDRMEKWIDRVGDYQGYKTHNGEPYKADGGSGLIVGYQNWPLPNVWLGVTAENQEMADKRIPILLQIPAAVRFVSVEPILGPIDLIKAGAIDHWTEWDDTVEKCEANIDWVICGGETGPNARLMHPDWVRNLRDQCQEAGASFFFKSWGKWMPANNSSKARDGLWVHENGDTFGTLEGEPFNPTATAQHMVKVGKQAAGRLLDGREWNEMPGRSVK